MTKFLYKMFFAFLIFSLPVFSDGWFADHWWSPVPIDKIVFHKIESFGIYSDNFTISLEDGSEWKIHTRDSDTLKGWQVDDEIYLGIGDIRFYSSQKYFFTMTKKNTEETINVALQKSPSTRLTIVKITESIHFLKHGDIIQRCLTLSDGSVWAINSDIQYFDLGDSIYFTYKIPFSFFKAGPGVRHYMFKTDVSQCDYPVCTHTRKQ